MTQWSLLLQSLHTHITDKDGASLATRNIYMLSFFQKGQAYYLPETVLPNVGSEHK